MPVHMPAEWEPHEGCLMAWPVRTSLWGRHLEAAEQEYAATARAIAEFEPVTMVVPPGSTSTVMGRCGGAVTCVELDADDSWVRDSGPIVVIDEAVGGDGEDLRVGLDFTFNSWGEKFLPYDRDAALAAGLLDHLGMRRRAVDLVLEGGSIGVDGRGTLVTTEQCLLDPSRNPHLDRDEIADALRRALGVDQVIWLPFGIVEDRDTDGHVDLVCAFVAPGRVLVQTAPDPASPNHERMSANVEAATAAVDAVGEALEVIEMPHLATFEMDGERQAVSYVNFYVANGGVVVPVAEQPSDDAALDIVAAAFPDRRVVGVASRTVGFGGGGTHCITQQIPQGGRR